MLLSNGLIDSLDVRYPENLSPYIHWCGTCQPTEIESDSILTALIALSHEIKRDPPRCGLTAVNVILLDREVLELSLSDKPSEMGLISRLIILPLHRWRQRELSLSGMITAVLEEFSHVWYSIDDELLVEQKVLECFRHLVPTVQLADIYNPNWKPDAG